MRCDSRCVKAEKMAENKKNELLERIRAIEKSAEAREIRERLAGISRKLENAPKGAPMDELLADLTRTQRIIDKDFGLKALYGLQAKTLREAIEFKRTGKRIIID